MDDQFKKEIVRKLRSERIYRRIVWALLVVVLIVTVPTLTIESKDAKHLIVKTLENLYGDADPADTHKAQDEVVERVAKEIAQNIILPEGGTS